MSAAPTIRDRIKGIQVTLRDGLVTADVARSSLVSLTALLGNVGDEVIAAELAYKRKLLEAMQTHEAANRARIEAECSPEYARHLEAKHTYTMVLEMTRSCKAYLRSVDEERRLER